MLIVKVLPFVVIGVLVVTAATSSKISESRSKWPFVVGDRRSDGLPDIGIGIETEEKLPKDPADTPVNQVTPQQTALNGTSNLSDLNGDWLTRQENKLYLNIAHREGLPGVVKKALRKSFSNALFEHYISQEIRNKAIQSHFIHGMAKGTLPAQQYGGYMVQDTAYLFNAVGAWNTAAKQMEEEDPQFAQFFMLQAEKYSKYYEKLLKEWRLENAESVVMGPAGKMYMGYQTAVSEKEPKYLPIAMLPCTMLWPWMAGGLIDSVDATNPYYSWFLENKRDPGHQSSLEKFVDEKFGPEDEKKAVGIFCEGIANELNFFREACGEVPFTLPEICQL